MEAESNILYSKSPAGLEPAGF